MSHPLPPLAHAATLLGLADAAVWQLDHAQAQWQADPATIALLLDAPPGPGHLAMAHLQGLAHPDDWPQLAALCKPAATDDPQTAVVRLRNRHGAWRWLRLRGQVVARDAAGLPTLSVGLLTDVSNKVRHREHLRLQQAFTQVMASSPDRQTLINAMLDAVVGLPDLNGGGFYLRDGDGGYNLVAAQGLSPNFVAQVSRVAPGSERARLVDAGHMVFTQLATEDTDAALLQRPELQAEHIQSLVVLPIRVDGQVRACLNLASTQARQLHASSLGLLESLAAQFGVALERLSAREDAQQQRDNLEGFFQAMQDCVFVLDEQGRIQFISDSVRRVLGYGDELLGQHILAVHPTRVYAQATEVVGDMLAGRSESCPLPVLAADGREIPMDTRIVHGHWNGQPALLGVSRDTSAMVALQAELERRERYQRATLDNFPFLVWFKDSDGRFLAVNQPFAQACGRAQAQSLEGQTDLDVWPADLAAGYRADDQAVLASGQSKQTEELVESNGHRHWVETYKSPVTLDGEVVGTVGYARDISDRKATEQQLAHDHSLLRALINALPDLMWLKDPNGVYLACNTRFEHLYGHPEADIVGKTDRDFVNPELAEFFRQHDLAAMHKGGPSTNEETLRFASDGHEERVETIKTPVVTPDGTLLGVLGIGRDITQRVQAEAERSELLERLQRIAAHVPGVIYQYHKRNDGSAHFPYASPGMVNIYGITPEGAQEDSSQVFRAIFPDDAERIAESIEQSAQSLTTWDQEYRVVLPDGDVRWVHGQSSPQRLPDGSTIWHGYIRDITTERDTRERLRLAASVFANSYDGIMITDADNRITEVNPAFTRITGYEPQDVLGQSPSLLSSGRQNAAFYAQMWATIHDQGHWSGEVWNRRKNGEVYAEILSISTMRGDDGRPSHYLAVFSDITRLKDHEAQLAHIAHFDALTGLPNRRLLGDRMQVALAHARRDRSPLAVCMLDVDGFKDVNDRHGHAAGDELLVELARRLKASLREDDTIARLGGDEFVLLMTNLRHPEESHSTLERLLQTISQPMELGSTTVTVSASVGMTSYPADEADADTLLRHADQAMYVAKQSGKNRYHLFDPEHDRQIKAHREQLDRLKQALADGELRLHYQPKVNLRTGEVLGMEALIRWQHPTEGLLPPGHFLPAVQGHAFENRLGAWVITQALDQLTQWDNAGLSLVVSVNISANHLLHSEFAAQLALALAAHPQAKPQHLELEILETAALGDMALAARVLHECRALGVRFSLDDFGTGYSSLAYFRSLPIDVVKIDQSFVRDMLEDPNDLGIVDSVVRLSQAFNRPVIAEGVETLQHGRALLQLGCEWAQGYGIAKPMPAEQVPGWMAQWAQGAIWLTLQPQGNEADLALASAVRSHEQWMATVRHTGPDSADKATGSEHAGGCLLGRWLNGGGAVAYGHASAFRQVVVLHEQVHALADALRDSAQTATPEATDRVRSELERTSQALLARLQQLTAPGKAS